MDGNGWGEGLGGHVRGWRRERQWMEMGGGMGVGMSQCACLDVCGKCAA